MYTEKIKEVVSFPIQKKIFPQNQKYPSKQKEDVTQFFKPNSPNIFENKNTGLSDQIKMGIENLSGYSLDDVKVHYNSDKPAQLQALAYTQGTDIYVASGQEKYLPHEAWHVVQQKQGRVYPTIQSNGMNINQDNALEYEADIMGEKALSIQMKSDSLNHQLYAKNTNGTVVQMRDDSVKIYADKIGTDPTGLGLTCHHVIPAGLLERFYNLCKIYSRDEERVKKEFEKWKTQAAQSANTTSTIRKDQRVSQESDDYEREVASACQWMSGNIFIGPSAECRIDDVHDESAFDYSAYKVENVDTKKEIRKREEINKAITKLESIYDRIITIIENINQQIDRNILINRICRILEDLTIIAAETNTLHKKNNPTTAAYEISDWISVGKPKVPRTQSEVKIFFNMYKDYSYFIKKQHEGQEPTLNQRQFCDYFKELINIDECRNLEKRSFVIARHTYNILYIVWQKCK